MPCQIEELSHTAEVGLRVRAATPGDLFACAALGMFQLIGVPPGIQRQRHSVVVESFDAVSLLVDWLSELLYLHETTGAVFDRCDVASWTPTRLVAVVAGGRPATRPERAIKAVTYAGLQLVEDDQAWRVDVYFDV